MNFCLEHFDNTEPQFRDMRHLLMASYRYLNKPVNWLLTRLEDWRYGGSAVGRVSADITAVKKAWLWRTPDGVLAGFCIKEHEGDSVWIQIHPDHAELTKLALQWLSQAWNGNQQRVQTFTDSRDQFRQAILEQLGFRHLGLESYVWGFDLTAQLNSPTLPPGYQFSNLASAPTCKTDILKAINTCFHETVDTQWLENKLNAPTLDPARIWFIQSPSNEVVSFCFGWLDEQNQVSELEPLGTLPERRRKGFAKALIQHAFLELKYRGVHHAFIGSGSETSVTSSLYRSLDPCGKWNTQCWEKSAA